MWVHRCHERLVQGSSIETVANTYAEETSNEKQLLVLRTLKLTTYLLLDPNLVSPVAHVLLHK